MASESEASLQTKTDHSFSHYSDSCPPSSNTTAGLGFSQLNSRLRSVLIHPVGLPLVCYLNCVDTGDPDNRRNKCSETATTIEDDPELDAQSTICSTRDYIEQLYSKDVATLAFDFSSSDFNDVFLNSYEIWKENSDTYLSRLATYRIEKSKWKEWKIREETRQALWVQSMGEERREASWVQRMDGETHLPIEPVKPVDSNEHVFTDMLCGGISSNLPSIAPNSTCGHQYSVVYDPHKPSNLGSIDFLLCHEDNNDHSIALITEFGISCDWWRKASQNLQYVEAIRGEHGSRPSKKIRHSPVGNSGLPDVKNARFCKPMLFAVVTFDPTKEKDFASAALGVFLCVPVATSKRPRDFRLALLWRTAPKTLQEMSNDFGRVLRAAILLPKLLRAISDLGANRFRQLGPHCCRVGKTVRGTLWYSCLLNGHFGNCSDSTATKLSTLCFTCLALDFKVLRAYDSRFRPTFRRPELYFVEGIAKGSNLICSLEDCRHKNPPPTQSAPEGCSVIEEKESRNHLFRFKGKLEIIATPFHDGEHYARDPADFIPVVEHLQTIHRNGCVHGDVRCFNIVFGKCLIDYDLGGRTLGDDPPTFPEGYNFSLASNDGFRNGEEGLCITMEHDTFAMTSVIFICHVFEPPSKETAQESTESAQNPELRPIATSDEVEVHASSENEEGTNSIELLMAQIKMMKERERAEERVRSEREALMKLKEDLAEYPSGTNGGDSEKQLSDLLVFLKTANVQGWQVKLGKAYRLALSSRNINVTDASRDQHDPQTRETGFATGSPNQPRI
jgi:hypothetical protein